MIAFTLFLLMAQQVAPAPVQKPRQPAETKHEAVVTTQDPQFLAKRLIGTWEQPPKGEDGMGVMLTLAPDGAATISSGIMEDLNYNFDGKRLIVVDADDPDDVKQTSTVVLNGDAMKETNVESGESAEFVRVRENAKGANLLVGEWKRDTGHLPVDAGLSESEKAKRLEIAQNGRYYYKPDGRLFVRIPLSRQTGRWDLASDGTLRLEFEGKEQESKVSFEDDDLALIHTGGKEIYHKAEWQ